MAIVPQDNPPKTPVPVSPSVQRPRVYVSLSRNWLVIIALLILAPWGLVGLLVMRSMSGTRSRPVKGAYAATPNKASDVVTSQPGEWGQLEVVPILISPPLELIDLLDPRRINNDWLFAVNSPTELRHLLQQCGLTEDQIDRLLAGAQSNRQGGMVVKPDRAVRSELAPTVRAKLYNHLAANTRNLDQTNAFRFTGTLDAWFDDVNLDPKTVELVKQYVYNNGSILFFADLPLVMDSLSKEEMLRLIKVLSRERTFLVKLRVESTDGLEKLVDYWSVGGRLNDVRPILESIYEAESDPTIDITHLLPPFARRRLYTYANPQNIAFAAGRDCHWTALNFFGEVPDDKFATKDYPGIDLSNFQRIADSPRFGDLVVFRQKNVHFHSAIYIADDLVYTKNGSKYSRPWMLMHIHDLLHYYPQHDSPTVDFFRQVPGNPPPSS